MSLNWRLFRVMTMLKFSFDGFIWCIIRAKKNCQVHGARLSMGLIHTNYSYRELWLGDGDLQT